MQDLDARSTVKQALWALAGELGLVVVQEGGGGKRRKSSSSSEPGRDGPAPARRTRRPRGRRPSNSPGMFPLLLVVMSILWQCVLVRLHVLAGGERGGRGGSRGHGGVRPRPRRLRRSLRERGRREPPRSLERRRDRLRSRGRGHEGHRQRPSPAVLPGVRRQLDGRTARRGRRWRGTRTDEDDESLRGRLANRVREERDRGSSILEFAGFLPILIVIGLAVHPARPDRLRHQPGRHRRPARRPGPPPSTATGVERPAAPPSATGSTRTWTRRWARATRPPRR